MILRALSAIWTADITSMENHLWQSTLFAGLAAILSFTLRKNQASVRYWIWLTASLKFLLPLPLLMTIGSHLAKPRASTPAQILVYSAVENLAQPFAGEPLPLIRQATSSPAPVSTLHLLAPIVVAVWLLGIAVVIAMWVTSWIRISLTVRQAVPVDEGPELAALRHVESNLGAGKQIKLVLSRSWMEPGIFGIFRPILIWPERISSHLDDRHIEAIFAHEVCHARRQDNFTALLHMLVEAVFWFHPLVWWMGARLDEERERACDEEVGRHCRQPRVYAESILRVCKFCSKCPLACASGITGANLKKRVIQIMTGSVGMKLGPGRKLLLLVVGLGVVASVAVVLYGQTAVPDSQASPTQQISMPTQRLEFDVASIRRNKSGVPPHSNFSINSGTMYSPTGGIFSSTNRPLIDYIAFAYKMTVSQRQDLQLPTWALSEGFDIEAKSENHDPTKDQMRLMMQSLLANRFKLVVHAETRRVSVFALVLAKPGMIGPQLKPHPADKPCLKTDPTVPVPDPASAPLTELLGAWPMACGGVNRERPAVSPVVIRAGGRNLSMESLADSMNGLGNLNRPVVNQTGLTGNFDFVLEFAPEIATGENPGSSQFDLEGTTFEKALKEQLGLKLNSQKGMVDDIHVDHVERPTDN